MPVEPSSDVTEILLAWNRGEPGALDRLLPAVQKELHRAARGYTRMGRPDHTLQATALVNETYLRLVDQTRVTWRSRAHFIGVDAPLMRRILVDHARRRAARKRGGPDLRLTLAVEIAAPDERIVGLVALDAALERLEALEVSAVTIKRGWIAARAFLYRELNGETA